MNKTSFTLGSLLLASGLGAQEPVVPPKGSPNVVLIVADDLGVTDLSHFGNRDMRTPHIDSIARQGTSFAQAYVTAPVCMPSRMGFMTGRYQQRFGMQTLGNDNIGIPSTEMNLGQMLQGRGYATGVVGKWHMGMAPEYRPNVRGFDEFYGFLNGNTSYYPGTGQFWRNDQKIPKPAYLTDGFGDEAVDFVNRHAGHPFFLYLSFNAPHSPMQAPAHYLERFLHIPDQGRRLYAAMTAAMDDSIGRVLTALREKGLEDNTIIIFLSDNGGAPQNYSENTPFRLGKYEVYEGGLRTPFFVQWKAGGLPAGAQIAEPISALDIVPTVLAAVKAPADLIRPLDGIDLLPALRGRQGYLKADRRLYWRYGPYQAALRAGDWKIVQCGVGDNKNPAWELYNLAQDAGEENDLAAKHPEKLRELAKVFEDWDRTLPPVLVKDQRLLDGKIWWRKRAALDGSPD